MPIRVPQVREASSTSKITIESSPHMFWIGQRLQWCVCLPLASPTSCGTAASPSTNRSRRKAEQHDPSRRKIYVCVYARVWTCVCSECSRVDFVDCRLSLSLFCVYAYRFTYYLAYKLRYTSLHATITFCSKLVCKRTGIGKMRPWTQCVQVRPMSK